MAFLSIFAFDLCISFCIFFAFLRTLIFFTFGFFFLPLIYYVLRLAHKFLRFGIFKGLNDIYRLLMELLAKDYGDDGLRVILLILVACGYFKGR